MLGWTTSSCWLGTEGRAWRWGVEGTGTDVLRGRNRALEGSPTVDSVSKAGGGWLLEKEATGSSDR
jgi:hypothetical protein